MMTGNFVQVLPILMEKVLGETPGSILDIGMGIGINGLLLREMLEMPGYGGEATRQREHRIDGVELIEGHRTPVHGYIYDNLYGSEFFDTVSQLPDYDTIILFDVLAYLSKDDGLWLIDELVRHTVKGLYIIERKTPPGKEELTAGAFERKSIWSFADFSKYDYAYYQVTDSITGMHLFEIFPRKQDELKAGMELQLSMLDGCLKEGKKQMKIGFVLPHLALTGGMKILLELMQGLNNRGHKITAIYRGDGASSAIPSWSSVQLDREILIPTDGQYRDYVSDCEVVVAGWFDQLPELCGLDVPVFYYEQGHEWLFGDINDVRISSTSARELLKEHYTRPCFIASASPYIEQVLKSRYGIIAPHISNGVEVDRFPVKDGDYNSTILLVGNPLLWFKGFGIAIA
ncbi:MAG TPA: hypothetical protein VD757_00530, partial [Candidatus Nitrosocosmicus sp.]|nr:hypothetical protein [Candidatus Nitrosocosmicus sp.]